MEQSLLAEIIKLTADYQSKWNESLENRCIIKILDYCLDLSNYDIIDAIYHNRVGPVVISYQLIKELCQQLKIKHLFEAFLNMYIYTLPTYLDNLLIDNKLVDSCYICFYSIMIDTHDDTYYIGFCENNHQMIWTNEYIIADKYFCSIQLDHKCGICDRELKTVELPKTHRAHLAINGDIIITSNDTNEYQQCFHSSRRSVLIPSDLPRGKCFSINSSKEIEIISACIPSCKKDKYKRSSKNNKYIEEVYSMYQETKFSEQEKKNIKLILGSDLKY